MRLRGAELLGHEVFSHFLHTTMRYYIFLFKEEEEEEDEPFLLFFAQLCQK